MLDDVRPDFAEARPIVVDRFRPIAADEGVHPTHFQQSGGVDDFLDLGDRALRLVAHRRQRIGVVAQATDGDSRIGHDSLDFRGPCGIELRHIDMRDARISAFRLAGRPAHQLHAVIADLAGQVGHFTQIQVR